MIALWSAGLAFAGPEGWGQPRPYVYPVLNLGVVATAGGDAVLQATAGVVGGAKVKYRGGPGWLWDTRGSVVGLYGLPSGSIGADLRVGSFVGPDLKLLTYQIGPEFWVDGYGTRSSTDYWLPWSPGVDLMNELTIKLLPEVHLIGQAAPGFAFEPPRHGAGEVAPFDELMVAAMLDIRTNVLGLTVGWSRQYYSFGHVDGLILSGGF